MSNEGRTDNTTIHDVARRLGLSATTVWRAVHDRPRISSRTRRRVLDEVRRSNYRPSLVAQTLSSGKSQALGVVVPTISNPVFAALVRAVEMAAFERGYNIILCDTDFDLMREGRHVELLLRRRAEGVILVPFTRRSTAEQAHLDGLARQRVPLVAMQQRLVGLPARRVAQVVPDNVGAAAMVVRHLINLGHRRIAFAHCGLSPRMIAFHERYRGYAAAMRDAGIDTNAERLVAKVAEFEPRVPGAGPCDVGAVERLLRDVKPTAIFAPADVLALRVMSVLRSMSVRVPEDVAVVGFDDIQMAETSAPPLTTVRQPTARVGRRAAELLFDAIEGNPNSLVKVESIPCELIVRSSCGTHA